MIDIINEMYAGDEPAFNDQWEFYLVDTEYEKSNDLNRILNVAGSVSSVGSKVLGSLGLGGFNAFSIPNVNIESMSIPTNIPNFEFENSKLFQAVESSVNISKEITMSIRESKFFTIYRYFQIWVHSIYDFDKLAYKKNYRNMKKLGILIFTNNVPKNNKIEFMPVKVVLFYGMRFKSINDTIELSHTDGQAIKYNVTFMCDKVIHA